MSGPAGVICDFDRRSVYIAQGLLSWELLANPTYVAGDTVHITKHTQVTVITTDIT